MNKSQSSFQFRLFIGCWLTSSLLLFSACNQFSKSNAESAIQKYVQRTFYRPDTYKAVHYYTPRKMKVSTDPADRNNSSFSNDQEKNVDGWGIAIDISAVTRNNEVSSQSAAFYLTPKCDIVIFTDVAPQFLKEDSLSIFSGTH